jgi:hypothetical protein
VLNNRALYYGFLPSAKQAKTPKTMLTVAEQTQLDRILNNIQIVVPEVGCDQVR